MLRKIILTFILLHSIALIAQNKNGNGEDVAGTKPPFDIPQSGKPWETKKTFGVNQVPAFKWQTRIGSAHTFMSALLFLAG
jgi:hypothetical protein